MYNLGQPKNLCDYMDDIKVSLANLKDDEKGRITSLEGGHGFQRKLRVMGIREGQIIKIITKQPFKGPYTIEVCGSHVTIGRGMAQKIFVEVIK